MGNQQLYSAFHNGNLIPDCGGLTRLQSWRKLKAKLADQYSEPQLNAEFLRKQGYSVRLTGYRG